MRIAVCTLLLLSIGATLTWAAPTESRTQTDELGQRACTHSPSEIPEAPLTPTFDRGNCDADWQALGPFGGDVEDVAVSPTNPDIVLAGLYPSSGSGTLFRSTNGGASWTEVTALSGKNVYDIDFTSTGIAYIGTSDSVWKSTDDGANWTQLNLNIGLNDTVHCVTIDPTNEDTIWAGVDDALGNQDKNVLKSVNGGSTWTDFTPNMTPMACRGIALDNGIVMAAFGGSFGGGSVWLSEPGSGWQDISTGLPANPMNDIVYDGTRFIVCGGQAFGSQYVGVYAYSWGGGWTALSDGTWTSLVVNDIEFDPANPATLYAGTRRGVFKSVDGGVNWTFGIGGTDAMVVNAVRLEPGSSTNFFVGCSSVAIWHSDDGGATILPSSVGIGQLNVYDVDANPLDIDELAIAFQGLNDGGVYTSTNGGLIWTLESNLPPTRYGTVQFGPDGTLYAISNGPTSIAPEGLYRRNGDGTWTCLGPDQGTYYESELRCVQFSDVNPDLIFMGGNDFGVAGWEATVWRSTNAGTDWTKVHESAASNEYVYDLAIIRDGTDLVISAARKDNGTGWGGAMRSTDGGTTWGNASTGLASTAAGYCLSADPVDPQTIYLGDGNTQAAGTGLYVSHDGGKNWASTGYTGQHVFDLLVDPRNGQNIYIIQWSSPVVLISTNSGGSFTAFNTGLSGAGGVRTLAYANDFFPRLLISTTTGSYATDICRCPNEGCEADLNGNCVVDLSDLAELLSNYGMPGGIADGDINPPHDGMIALDDLAFLLSQYGEDCN